MTHQAMAKTARLLTQSVSCAVFLAMVAPAQAQENTTRANTSDLQPRTENGRQIYEATQFARFGDVSQVAWLARVAALL